MEELKKKKKYPVLARQMSFPMRSLADAATQTPSTVILFLKSHSPVSILSLSLFGIASFFIFLLTLFVFGALSSFHFQQLDAMETVHRNPIPFFSFFFQIRLIISRMMKWQLMQGQRPQTFQTLLLFFASSHFSYGQLLLDCMTQSYVW